MRHRGRRAVALALSGLLGAAALSAARPAAAAEVPEYPVPIRDVAPLGLAAAPDGSVWFTEMNAGIGKVDGSGKVTEYAVGKNSQGVLGVPDAITTAPDGTLWFTDASTAVPRIGKIDKATGKSTFTEVPDLAGNQITDITAGPDGNMWFTGNGNGALGRITPSGAVTTYDMNAYGLSPYAITAGPDKALWFTDSAGGAIGRIDPATAEVSIFYPSSSLNGSPALGGITSGPDGALWFTEPGVGMIGRVGTDGAITEYRLPTADAAPAGIVTGSDGNLWFTEAAGSNIGRITPSGQVSEYPLPSTLSAPMRIVSGPGGRLWFTEQGKGAIGSIDPSAPPSGQRNLPPQPVAAGSSPRIAAPFQGQCPTGAICLAQVTMGGTAKVGSVTLPLPPGGIRLTGYIKSVGADGTAILQPPVMGQQYVSPPVDVPGGLIGQLPLVGAAFGMTPLATLDFNKLTVSQTLAGPVKVTLSPVSATVQLNIHLNNQLLGTDCVIGPVTQTLAPESLTADANGDPVTLAGWTPTVRRAAGTFGIPAAKGCGPFGLLDGIINATMGLPSNSGAVDLPLILSLGSGANVVNTPVDASATATAARIAKMLGTKAPAKAKKVRKAPAHFTLKPSK
ncbi:hypothetical protein [Actinomadura sp. NTSP31]|uniref:Vgb family protein n=1 Tax=Actinomadura sp. NTSP31 TaxID=1735447 RepID=UPI0035BF35DE